MSKLFIEDTTLTAIGDAIREKTGTTDLIAPLDMPSAIGGIETGGGGGSDITSWDIDKAASSVGWVPVTSSGILDKYMDGKSFTVNITSSGGLQNLFTGSEAKDLSKVVINFGSSYSQAFLIFNGSYVEKFPKLNLLDGCAKTTFNFRAMFKNTYNIKYIDNDFWQTVTSLKDANTEATTYQLQEMFYGCRYLRQLPDLSVFDSIIQGSNSSNYQLYYAMCSNNHVLDTLDYIPVINFSKSVTSNMFSSTFYYCYRLKDAIFATDNGTPYVRNWSKQTIDLSTAGFATSASNVTSYGIASDKAVTDDATYQALKDDPDWFSVGTAYSRYNHDSAVRTINSLPDCSAVGNNTIKFKGEAGASTDGGAINTLTEAEIAVAAAKGWTVSLV